jgi:type IX secretion system PorP/SprF family membrane protein
MIRKILFLIALSFSAFKVSAQDAHLSLYDAAPLFLNPAMTGVFEGDWRIHGQYRTQWKAVNFKPYSTALLSFDMPVKKWGFGAQITNVRAGIGNFNSLQGTVAIAYTTSIDKRKKHNISFGVQGGVTQKSLEYQLLTYNNQYTTDNGGIFDPNIDPQENLTGQSLIVPVVNAGFMYFFAKQESRFNPFLGISAFNLTTPIESFNGLENRLPMRFYGHAGTRINFTELFYILPKVLVMQQEQFFEQTYAIDAGYYLKGSDLYIVGGVVYRNKDAMIVSLGAKMENIVAKIAYDVNISTLTTSTTGRGGFEVSLTYIKKKKKPTTEKICPRL